MKPKRIFVHFRGRNTSINAELQPKRTPSPEVFSGTIWTSLSTLTLCYLSTGFVGVIFVNAGSDEFNNLNFSLRCSSWRMDESTMFTEALKSACKLRFYKLLYHTWLSYNFVFIFCLTFQVETQRATIRKLFSCFHRHIFSDLPLMLKVGRLVSTCSAVELASMFYWFINYRIYVIWFECRHSV